VGKAVEVDFIPVKGLLVKSYRLDLLA